MRDQDTGDQQLILDIQSGNDTAFETLYRMHVAALWGFALQFVHRPDVAKDLVQDIFSSIWINRQGWAPRPPLRAYLYRAVRNRAISAQRHDRVVDHVSQTALLTNTPIGMGEHAMTPDESAVTRENQARLRTAIDALPERQRSAFLLWWHDDLRPAEIGHILDISSESARRLLIKAQTRLLRVINEF